MGAGISFISLNVVSYVPHGKPAIGLLWAEAADPVRNGQRFGLSGSCHLEAKGRAVPWDLPGLYCIAVISCESVEA
jgi:hypothetical protein